MSVANEKVRNAAREKHVKHWEIAEKYGISESTFCCKLRRELPEEEQNRIISIIDNISAERKR